MYDNFDPKKIEKMIMTFEPLCIKCGKNLSNMDPRKGVEEDYRCPKCGHDIIDSAIQQVELHFRDAPKFIRDSFKDGIIGDHSKGKL